MAGVAQIFRTLNSSNTSSLNRHLPMINEITSDLSQYFGAYTQLRKKKALVAWYKRIPELTAFINKVATDSTSRWHFEPINPKDSSRNKILSANRFAQEVSLNKTNNSTFADALITGEGFVGWDSLKKKMFKKKSKG